MKRKSLPVLIAFFALFSCLNCHALEELPEDWTDFNIEQVNLQLMIDESLKRQSDLDNLKIAKHFLIGGNLEMSKFFLDRIDQRNKALDKIRDRYLALIDFIEDRPTTSLERLGRPEYNDLKSYPHICLLRVLNQLAGPANQMLEDEMNRCKTATLSSSKNGQFWLENIQKLKFQRQGQLRGALMSDVSFLIESNEIVRIWLKTGLYFNQEELILRHLSTMPQSVYASPRARELLGLLYYRLGDEKMALEFIEGLETPNSENIRGNINLKARKYEIAFGHFQLALKLKANSLNALERSLPLAWKLEQWAEGMRLLDKLIVKEGDKKLQEALRIAFTIRQEKYEFAQDRLNALERAYQTKLPLEIELMKKNTSLKLGLKNQVKNSANRACLRFEGVSCWVAMSEGLWENFGKTLNREDHAALSPTLSFQRYRTPQTISPLEEALSVDQKDIEELDEQRMELRVNQ